jgi:hypothetical protein
MVERCRGVRLRAEPARERFVVGESVVEHLHCDAAAKTGVVGEEHEGRRTGPDRCDQPVPTAQDPTDLVGHPRDDHSFEGTAGARVHCGTA